MFLLFNSMKKRKVTKTVVLLCGGASARQKKVNDLKRFVHEFLSTSVAARSAAQHHISISGKNVTTLQGHLVSKHASKFISKIQCFGDQRSLKQAFRRFYRLFSPLLPTDQRSHDSQQRFVV